MIQDIKTLLMKCKMSKISKIANRNKGFFLFARSKPLLGNSIEGDDEALKPFQLHRNPIRPPPHQKKRVSS